MWSRYIKKLLIGIGVCTALTILGHLNEWPGVVELRNGILWGMLGGTCLSLIWIGLCSIPAGGHKAGREK